MTRIHCIPNEAAMDAYRGSMTGERFGWAIHRTEHSFTPAHAVMMHPEDGPVIIVCDEVFAVDPEADDVFRTEETARDAYWARRATT